MNVERIEQMLLNINRQVQNIEDKLAWFEKVLSKPSDYKLPDYSDHYTICGQKERTIDLMKKYPTYDGKIDYGSLTTPCTVYGTHTFLDCHKQVDGKFEHSILNTPAIT